MATKLATIIADFTTQLASELSIAGTSLTLSSATDDDGVALPSGRYFFTIDASNSQKEHISCDLSGTSLTNIKTVSRQGVETAGALRKHRVGASIGITDFAHILQINALLAGTTDLNYLVPLKYDGTATISDLKQLATKAYVDGVAISGSPDATTATKGISTVSVAPVSAATPIVVGQNDPQFVNYFAETGAANAYVITPSPSIGAYAVGQRFSFKATNANTTTSTININGLGAKTIYKAGGATVLASGDIAAGMIVSIEYDGAGFLMLNPVANAPTTTTSTDVQVFTSSGTWTKPSGAKWVEVTIMGGGGAGGSGASGDRTSGGGGGGYSFKRFSASALGSTESVTVGAAGVAGANGTNGGNGGDTLFGTTNLLTAKGGSGGGASAAGGGVAANGEVKFVGGASSINGSQGVDTAVDPSPRGGGSAGYNGGSPATATAGGNGGAFITNYVKAGGVGGASGVNAGANGATTDSGLLQGGVGGGGGGFNGTGTNTGGNGGTGGFPGGGGGGSNGNNNTGGNGAAGVAVVVTYF